MNASSLKVKPIRVLIVDDHEFVAEGLRCCMSLEDDIEPVGRLSSASDLLDEIPRCRPDVIVMDIEMPGADPFDVIDSVVRHHPDVKIAMLTAFVRDGYVDRAIELGARGFFSKSDSSQDVIEGIRRVAAGKLAFGPSVKERVEKDDRREEPPVRSKLQMLTPREFQILRLIGKGLSRSEVARVLHRSPKTIDVHSTNIMRKLDIHDRVDLARYSIREGIVEA